MHGLVAKSLADVDISARKQKWSCCKHQQETARYDPIALLRVAFATERKRLENLHGPIKVINQRTE
jgi:hypothetical protein